jgi:hypothetical protein
MWNYKSPLINWLIEQEWLLQKDKYPIGLTVYSTNVQTSPWRQTCNALSEHILLFIEVT